MKSSLKFCVIATGEYDGYVAEPRASEWDIAAVSCNFKTFWRKYN